MFYKHRDTGSSSLEPPCECQAHLCTHARLSLASFPVTQDLGGNSSSKQLIKSLNQTVVIGCFISRCCWNHRVPWALKESMTQQVLSPTFFFLFLFLGCSTRHARSQYADQGSNLCPLQWTCGYPTPGSPGKSPFSNFRF